MKLLCDFFIFFEWKGMEGGWKWSKFNYEKKTKNKKSFWNRFLLHFSCIFLIFGLIQLLFLWVIWLWLWLELKKERIIAMNKMALYIILKIDSFLKLFVYFLKKICFLFLILFNSKPLNINFPINFEHNNNNSKVTPSPEIETHKFEIQ